MTDEPGTEVAKVPAPASEFGLASMWNSLVEIARDDTVDAAKLASLTSIQGQMIDREAQRRFQIAKAAAMAELPRITRNKQIVHGTKVIGRYRDYDSLRIIVDPILQRHNIRLSHTTGESAVLKAPTVSAILEWNDGELSYVERSDPMPVPIDSGGAKSGAQAVASSVTYGKRHTTTAILGIVFEGEDDDATRMVVTEPLSEAQEGWLSDAQVAASRGTDSYSAWWKGADKDGRAWLVASGHHDKLKASAAHFDEGRTEP